jgi:hypothetical protein
MSRWELVRQQYPTKLELTEPETHHLPYTTKESFTANIRGERILFAKFGSEAIYSRGVGHTWKFKDGRETVEEAHFKASFVDYGLVDNLDYHTGTAEFRGKELNTIKRTIIGHISITVQLISTLLANVTCRQKKKTPFRSKNYWKRLNVPLSPPHRNYLSDDQVAP